MTYAGDLTPSEAHALLVERTNAVLVDCRTQAEWTFVGTPNVAGARFVEWTQWPAGAPNENFVSDVAGGLEATQPIVVICRTGGRSAAAAVALTEAGFSEVYNVLDGFEGHPDAEGHRTGGWRGAGLPWHQA
ncbi:MAG: rhodanese-related sulfurtransferase [Verrucomicrobiales bacterium]|jgi:rhodanese-related sulfurtransferase